MPERRTPYSTEDDLPEAPWDVGGAAPGTSNPPEWGGWAPPADTSRPADFWIPPTASFGDDPSGKINRDNPFADPGKPFVQAGKTGGYQAGVGVTQRAGTSRTQADYDRAMAEIGDSPYAGGLAEWLRRNPDDETRYLEARAGEDGPIEGDRAGKGGGGGGGFAGSPDALRSMLQSLWGGAQNQGIINSRVSNARDTLERQKKSTLASQQAAMANRGLMSAPGAASGAEAIGYNNLSERISDAFSNATQSIYANESENADDRMMQALGLSAGLDTADRDRDLQEMLGLKGLDLGWFNAGTQRDLGLGGLAIQNMRGVNDYNLGLADLGLRRDLGLAGLENDDIDQLIKLIQQLLQGAQTSAGGFR